MLLSNIWLFNFIISAILNNNLIFVFLFLTIRSCEFLNRFLRLMPTSLDYIFRDRSCIARILQFFDLIDNIRLVIDCLLLDFFKFDSWDKGFYFLWLIRCSSFLGCRSSYYLILYSLILIYWINLLDIQTRTPPLRTSLLTHCFFTIILRWRDCRRILIIILYLIFKRHPLCLWLW